MEQKSVFFLMCKKIKDLVWFMVATLLSGLRTGLEGSFHSMAWETEILGGFMPTVG